MFICINMLFGLIKLSYLFFITTLFIEPKALFILITQGHSASSINFCIFAHLRKVPNNEVMKITMSFM